MLFRNLYFVVIIVLLNLLSACASGESEADDSWMLDKNTSVYSDGGILFVHMKNWDYGGLYYCISKDGVNWTMLNYNKTIEPRYNGHPDIMKGRDGRYYMIAGVEPSVDPVNPAVWVSEDLLEWDVECLIPHEVMDTIKDYKTQPRWFGAPKLFYDEDSDQYMITWHSCLEKYYEQGNAEWESYRTFYVLTKDFRTFTSPKRLFDFKSDTYKDMATIDTIVRKVDGKYYSIVKDERWLETSPTGKSVRICSSDNLTGPYCEPEIAVTPMDKDGYEAPILMPNPEENGWYIFAENIATKYYERFDAPTIESTTWTKFYLPIEDTRHGCMVRINQIQYDALMEKYGY